MQVANLPSDFLKQAIREYNLNGVNSFENIEQRLLQQQQQQQQQNQHSQQQQQPVMKSSNNKSVSDFIELCKNLSKQGDKNGDPIGDSNGLSNKNSVQLRQAVLLVANLYFGINS